MPTPEELKDILTSENQSLTDLKQEPSLPPEGAKTPDLDEESLSLHLRETLVSDELDKVNMFFAQKRIEDIRYYYQEKDRFMSQWPWPNASNFPVPIIPVMLDVGHTALVGQSNFPENVKVKGHGIEDRRVAPHREKILKAQLRDQLNIEEINDWNAFQVLLHGTSYIKVFRIPPASVFKVGMSVVPIENIYLPVDSKSPDIGVAEHVTEIIPLTVQDIIIRAQLKDSMGKPFFKNLDQISSGWNISGVGNPEEMAAMSSSIYGTGRTSLGHRKSYYWAETCITWYNSAGARPMELIVWWAPSTGAIFRWILNEDGVRHNADCYIYPNFGKAFHRSLTEILKHVQDKANYADKQATDASDIAISPSMFVPEGSSFEPGRNARVPTGVYKIPAGTQPYFEVPNISPILERKHELESIWNLAGNLSGFTEPLQGVLPSTRVTATTDVIRRDASNSRLKTLYKRYNRGLSKAFKLVDRYTELYMPRNLAIQILGVTEIQSINEIYSSDRGFGEDKDVNMLSGFNLDFYIISRTRQEIEDELQNRISFYSGIKNDLKFGQDIGNVYRIYQKIAEAMDVDDFEDVIYKPSEANILSVDQMINRVMSGQTEVDVSPNSDATAYLTAIQEFLRTASGKNVTSSQEKVFKNIMAKLELMQLMANFARNDFNISNAQNLAQSMVSKQTVPSNGGNQNVPVA